MLQVEPQTDQGKDVNRSAAVRQLPALSPLHETFRSGRYFKRTWTSK